MQDEKTKEELEKALDELDLYTNLLRKEPRLVRAWIGKGSALSRLGKFTESIKCFDKALQFDGENEEAKRKKACVLRFAGRGNEADTLDAEIKEKYGNRRGKVAKDVEEKLIGDTSAISTKLGIPEEKASKLAKNAGRKPMSQKTKSERSPRTRKQSAKRKITMKTEELTETFKAIEEKLEIKPERAVSIWSEIAHAVDERKEAEIEEEREEIEADDDEGFESDIEEEIAPILQEEGAIEPGEVTEAPDYDKIHQQTDGSPDKDNIPVLEDEPCKRWKDLEKAYGAELEKASELKEKEEKTKPAKTEEIIAGLESPSVFEADIAQQKSLTNENWLTTGKKTRSINVDSLRGPAGYFNGRIPTPGLSNGLINGKQEKTGLINGGYYNRLRLNKIRNSNLLQSFIVMVVVVSMVMATLVLYSPPQGEKGREIGSFDWSNELTYASTGTAPENINIDRFAAENSNGRTTFYLKVHGTTILAGEPDSGQNRTDTIHVFIDSDSNAETGYQINGIGADYLVRVYGREGKIAQSQLFTFNDIKDKEGLDWNAWSLMGSLPSTARGSEVEIQVSSYLLGLKNGDNAQTLFQTLSWNGQEDYSDGIVGTNLGSGLLYVRQTNTNSPIAGIGLDEPFLKIELQAAVSDIMLKAITFTRMGDASPKDVIASIDGQKRPVIFSGTRGILSVQQTIKKDNHIAIDLTTNTIGIQPGTILGFMIGNRDDVEVETGTVTLQSNFDGLQSYIGKAPDNIQIDGAFADWAGPFLSDLHDVNNPNIDVSKYAVKKENQNLSLYIRVDGEMMAGTKVPWSNDFKVSAPPPSHLTTDSDKDTVPDEIDKYPYDFNNDNISDSTTKSIHNGIWGSDVDGDGITDYPNGPDMWLNTTIPLIFPEPFSGKIVTIYIGPPPSVPVTEVPVVTGEDYAYIFIDSDSNPITGFSVSDIGADYLVNVTGKNSNIVTKKLCKFNGNTNIEWNWSIHDDQILVGKDMKQMEVGIEVGSLGLVSNASIIFMTKDWKNKTDLTTYTNIKSLSPDIKTSNICDNNQDEQKEIIAKLYEDNGVIQNPEIRLNNAVFDPIIEKPKIHAGLCNAIPNNYWLVQFKGPTQASWLQKLRELGGKIFSYIPDYTYIVSIDNDLNVDKVRSLSFVRYVGQNQPAFKIQNGLLIGNMGYKFIDIMVYENLQKVERLVNSMGGQVVYASGSMIRALVNISKIQSIAFIPEVEWIQATPVYRLCNDIAAQPGRLDVSPVWSAPYNLDGTGTIVAVCDTGLDTGVNDATMHLDFQGRIVAIHDSLGGHADGTADMDSGHGTHVTGSVLGSGARSSGQIKGMAPNAQLVFQACEYKSGINYYLDLPTNLNTLYQQAYNDGARIHTNSWGAATYGTYNADSVNTDTFTWNNRNFLILFAAGNEGIDSNSDGIVNPDSLNAPSTAKNVITIGASENLRDVGGYQSTYGLLWGTDYPVAPLRTDLTSDNSNGIVAFSSRGPCDDGRLKPDVVASGTNILSTKSSVATGSLWGPYNNYYWYSGGTSMATPLAAGCSAVVRQYYTSVRGVTSPSSALIKATLINGATDMPGQYTGSYVECGPIPNYNEGWGRIDVKNSIFPAWPRSVNFQDITSGFISSGKAHTYNYTVGPDVPLKITLAYSDYPGSPTAGGLVNDLDLLVTAPGGGTVYKGNAFWSGGASTGWAIANPTSSNANPTWDTDSDAYDEKNNVECVYIQTPVQGTYKITVTATNLGNVVGTDQDYALVVSGQFKKTNDTMVQSISVPKSQIPESQATISATIKNYGTADQTSAFNVRCRILDPLGTEVYNSVQSIGSLLSGATSVLTWFYTPTAMGTYTVIVQTELGTDEDTANNQKTDTMIVIPTIGLHGEITIDGTITDWLGSTPGTQNSWTVGSEEFIWNDAASDDKGDSDYTYPSDARWEAGCLDLREFRVCADSNSVNFLLKFTGFDNSSSGSLGFSEQVFEILIDKDRDGTGRVDTVANANLKLDTTNAWEYAVWADGFGNGRLVDEAGSTYNVLTVRGSTTTKAVEVSVPTANIGRPDMQKWRFTVMTGAQDSALGFRNVNAAQSATNGGGGLDSSYPDPNVYDVAFPLTQTEQNGLLNDYLVPVTKFANYDDDTCSASIDAAYYVDDAEWVAQSFTPSLAYKLTKVSILIADIENHGPNIGENIIVDLRNDNGGVPGSTILATTTVLGQPFYNFIDFALSYQFVASIRYWIVAHNTKASSEGYAWVTDDTAATFNGAQDYFAASANQGSTWTTYTTYDCWFRAYGELPANYVYCVDDKYQDIFFKIRSVVINEFSSYGTDNNEWIELYNNATYSVPMNGWQLTDQDGNTFVFGTNCPVFIIATNQYILVFTYTGTDDTTVNLGTYPNAWEEYWKKPLGTNIWGDSGDDILLTDGTHNIDYVAYDKDSGADEIDPPPIDMIWKNTSDDAGTGYGGQAPCPGSGQSVSLIPNGWDRDRAKDWYLGEATSNPPGAPAKITKGEENVIPEIPPHIKQVFAFSPVLVMLIARPLIKRWRRKKQCI